MSNCKNEMDSKPFEAVIMATLIAIAVANIIMAICAINIVTYTG